MAKWFLLVLYTALIVWWCNAPSTFGMSTNETDRLALLAFKAAIDDQASFGALSSWNDSVHYCDWHGILCSRRHRDRVVQLNLTSRRLVGSLSPHIGNLSFLRRIILPNNFFHGPIPEEIGRLFRLQVIQLSNNSFGGELPNNLSRCSNLEKLNLVNNQLNGNIPDELGSLSKLEALGLGKNMFSGTITPSIGNLTSLDRVTLAECNLRGEIPEGISKLRRLTYLSVMENKLSGKIPSGLYNISALNTLSLDINQLDGSIAPDICSKLRNLVFFNVFDNQFTGMIPNSLSNASGLGSINFGKNNFIGPMPEDLGELSDLQRMNFQKNQLEDDLSFISSLTNCTRLQFLIVSENLLKGSLPDSIANLSMGLNWMLLGRNQLHGSIPSGIGNLLNLSVLSMASNYFSGPIPDTIGRLRKLQYLELDMNKFTELPSSIFGNLTALNSLLLGKNNIHGSIPSSLGNCQNLLKLDLSHNNLYGSIPLEILNLSSISIYFNLGYNSLTGSLPSEVGSLKNLGKFDVSNNRLSGPIPNSLSGCLSLEVLNLEANSFEGEIPQSWSELRGLRELDLSRNNLTGLIPSYIGELALEKLNLSFNMLYGEVPTQGVFRNASAISIVGMDNLCGGIADLNLPPCPSSMSKRNKLSYKTKIILYMVVALVISSTLGVSLFMFRHRQRVSRKEDSSKPSFEHQILRVSYADLLNATNGFSEANLLGIGNYASVYKGILDQDQIVVAVKVLNLQLRGALKSFMLECKALQAIRHRNLLKVLSACSSIDFHGNEFKAIVYEFMANGTLDRWLHQNGAEHEYLKAIQRLDISINIASALEYLHCGCESTIVHGDLKPSNVLLDDTMAAHVGDFGLAKIISTAATDVPQHQSNSSAIRGTIGYIAPEYGVGDMASTVGDVYSFGILLLEMFTGKRPTDKLFKDQLNLHNFVKNALPDQVMDVVDPSIQLEHNNGSWINDCMVSILTIGVACSSELPRDRMEMGTVVSKLCKIKKSLGERRVEHT